MLSAIGAQTVPGGETELGAGISGGELPHAQACVLYILRTGIVEQLSETGQRLLLEKWADSPFLCLLCASVEVPLLSCFQFNASCCACQ